MILRVLFPSLSAAGGELVSVFLEFKCRKSLSPRMDLVRVRRNRLIAYEDGARTLKD
jgi:hypothetical protein